MRLCFGASVTLDLVLRSVSVSVSEITVVDIVGWQVLSPLPVVGLWPGGCKQKPWSETPGKTFFFFKRAGASGCPFHLRSAPFLLLSTSFCSCLVPTRTQATH